MDPARFHQVSETEWHIEPHDKMRVPGIIYAEKPLIEDMDDKVYEQVVNVAALPGIVKASYAMPDAHWGYGFPIGGVAAFDPEEGGVISAGGVGFDISCGVRNLLTGLTREEIEPVRVKLADMLFKVIPTGVGSTGRIDLNRPEMDAMLANGARWAVAQGYGLPEDLERIEEHGCMPGADPEAISDKARNRQHHEMGTLGSGNHYLEVQIVDEIFQPLIAGQYGLRQNEAVISIHCGSRGLGHQVGTEYLREMAIAAPEYGIELPDLELACAPISSPIGQRYLGAMRAATNCAFANRQLITHLVRQVFEAFFPQAKLRLLYDVSHNTCKEEVHRVNGKSKRLFVHRKGATRAFGADHPEIRAVFGEAGQPVLIGGSMGTASYVLAGLNEAENQAFGSACHGAGRRISRHQALRYWQGQDVIKSLRHQGVTIMSPTRKGVAEEAPHAYKDIEIVVNAAEKANLATKVVRLKPMLCIKG